MVDRSQMWVETGRDVIVVADHINGFKVEEFTGLEIGINEGDIAHGVRRNCDLCPVSMATTRAVKNLSPGPDLQITIPMPPHIKEFVRRYDDRLEVKPLTFRI